MAKTNDNPILQMIRSLAEAHPLKNVPDEELLQRFANAHDQAAFAGLMRRHGSMVLHVCRSVAGNDADAEDAFQATFLILAQRARSIRNLASIGSWLYGVAYRTALKAQVECARRQQLESQVPPPKCNEKSDDLPWHAVQQLIHAELSGLAERYRAPLVLCYLEGRTQDEAARHLGVSKTTLKKRLERGRSLLRSRLARRGLGPAALVAVAAWPAATLAARLPPALASTTVKAAMARAAGQTTAGLLSAQVTHLLENGLKTMMHTKIMIGTAAGAVVALILAVGGLAFYSPPAITADPALRHKEPTPLQAKAPTPTAPMAQTKKDASPPTTTKPNQRDDEVPVSGQIIDEGGKSVANAEVGVLVTFKDVGRGGDISERIEALGPVKTDKDGRFRLPPKHFDWNSYRNVQLVASADRHGLGWKDLYPEGKHVDLVLSLPREQVVQGRLVDLQGHAAAGVPVHLFFVGLQKPGSMDGVQVWQPNKGLPLWPAAVTTDKDGRFAFRGLGADSWLAFQVFDDRFARQILSHFRNEPGTAKEMTITLAPARIIEGEITAADTGNPLPHARLTVYAIDQNGSGLGLAARADEKGRFRVNPYPGSYFSITAYPPDGEPYLIFEKGLHWSPGTVKQQCNVAVPRGMLVRGKVTESISGNPVAGTKVQCLPKDDLPEKVVTGWQSTVVSGADGVFQMAVPLGSSHLAFLAPTADFIQMEVHSNKLDYDMPGGQRYYAHAWAPILAKAGPTKELQVKLQRGVTVHGKIVDSEGKAVPEALLISRITSLADFNFGSWHVRSLPVRGGKFELRGLDPKETYSVFFIDAKNKEGAVVQISGKDAGAGPVTVRLAPCGSAVFRFVDEDKKPVVGYSNCVLQLVIQPGVSIFDRKTALEKGLLFADTDFIGNLDRLNHWDRRSTDAEGRVTLPALIPGATYRFLPSGGEFDFQVEAGKTLQLPDIVLKKDFDLIPR